MDKDDKKYKQALQELSMACFIFLRRLDEVMKPPATPEDGKTIATLANRLEIANDSARYFYLGVDFRNDDKDEEWQRIKRNKAK